MQVVATFWFAPKATTGRWNHWGRRIRV